MKGPWQVLDSSLSRMTLTHPGNDPRRYDVERRRAEPGCLAGIYLFGPEFSGLLLESTTMESARFEATALIADRCSLPGSSASHIARAASGAIQETER